MKIAVIGHKMIPSRLGGVEIHVEELYTRLADRGHTVVIFNRSIYDKERLKSYKNLKLKRVFTVRNKKLEALIYSIFATIKVCFGNYDIIHYHALGPSVMAFIPVLLRKKVVCTIHGLDWQRAKWGSFAKKYLLFGEKIAVKYPDCTVTVSEPSLKYIEKKYNKKIMYIPNGVNLGKVVNTDLIKNKFQLEKDKFILFVARLVPEKGAHILIQAFNKISTDMKLVIVGDNPYEQEYITEIKEMATNNKNIIFTGYQNYDILIGLYCNAYLFILPSAIEGLPISLLEAMSFGDFCIVSDIEENKNIIKNFGLVFKTDNIEDLKDKIKMAIEQKLPEQERYNKERIKNYIKEKFNWDDVASITEKMYAKVLQKGGE